MMSNSHAMEILRDLQMLVTCPICQEQLTQPKLLPCQHGFCSQCLESLVKSNVEDTGGKNQFTCPSCRLPVFLTPSGISGLPVDIRANQIIHVIGDHQKHLNTGLVAAHVDTTIQDTENSDSESDASMESAETAELLWCKTSAEHIWDISFMADGSVLTVSSCHLKRLSSLEGCDMHLPFDTTFLHSPCAVATTEDAVVIIDWFKGNNESFLTVKTKHGSERNDWDTTTKPISFQPNGISVLPSGSITITGTDEVRDSDVLLHCDMFGNTIWCKTYPANTLGPYLATDSTGKTYISTPTKNSIDVYSATGEHMRQFPAEGVHEPRGLCFSTAGHLLIADQSNSKVSMFDVNGTLIEDLVTLNALPNSICIYDDNLLAVTDWQQKKLFFYELNKSI